MSKKTKSASQKLQSAAYKADSRAAKNRARKLARHMKKHPNDAQAERMVGKAHTYRKAPRVKGAFPAEKWVPRDGAGNALSTPTFATFANKNAKVRK